MESTRCQWTRPAALSGVAASPVHAVSVADVSVVTHQGNPKVIRYDVTSPSADVVDRLPPVIVDEWIDYSNDGVDGSRRDREPGP